MKIYDKTNNYEYANGTTTKELIKNWNDKRFENFAWIEEYEDSKELFEESTIKIDTISEIENIIYEINNIEVNQIAIIG